MSFKPIVMTTYNVPKTISEVAHQYKIKTEDISFDLIAYGTYFRKSPSNKWVSIDNARKKQLSQASYLACDAIHFKEQYKIKLYAKATQQTSCQPLMRLNTNNSKSKVQLIIKKESTFALNKNCLQEYIEEIKRQLLYGNFMLGMFTLHFESALAPVIAHFKKYKGFTTDLKIIISTALEPQTNSKHKFIPHYLKKAKDQRTAYEQGVDSQELIYEYIFPVMAKAGRSCQGVFLKPLGAEITCNDVIYFDDTIKMVIGDHSLQYYALKAGYVDLEDQNISISNSLKLESAAFNTTGSITMGGQRDINVKITSNNDLEDAIDKGVNIDVSTIDVNGSIAGNTTVKAESVKIGAQTHKKAKIIAQEDASVYLHRGDLKAKDVDIAKLEHGIVEAEQVKVKEVLGGEIRARNVEIALLHSNAKIYASESITIGKIKGSNNKLIIAPDKIEDQEVAIDRLTKAAEDKRETLLATHKEYEERLRQFNNNYSRIEEFKQQIARAVKSGKSPPKAASIRVKQYQLDSERLNHLQEDIKRYKLDLEDTLLDLDKHKNLILFAKISYKGSWDGYQEIYYEHMGSNLIEKYTPEGHIPEIVYSRIKESELVPIAGFNES